MKTKLPLLQDPASGFPPLHARWLDGIFGAPLPRERRATCHDCAMLPPRDEPPDARAAYFDPSTKCCTYFPRLPSFLVGGVLAEGDPASLEGRSRLEARIDARVGVTPLGVGPPSHYDALYDPSVRFGHSPSLRCPYHLDDGGCGVWGHRNGVCMTWFCKHERGEISRELWMRVEQLLTAAEQALARWCALELDVGGAALAALHPHPHRAAHEKIALAGDLDGRIDDARYRAQWGAWLGREREFFVSCAEIVAALGWADVERIGGAEVMALAEVARAARANATSRALASRVAVAPFQVVALDRETTRIVTYSPHDPIDLPIGVVEAMPAIAAADERARARLVDEETLRRLVDFGLLRAVDPDA